MLTPAPAPVRPRGIPSPRRDPLPRDDALRSRLDPNRRGVVAVLGPPGSGRTTALRHLLHVFANEPVTCLDEPSPDELADAAGRGLTVYAAAQPWRDNHLAVYRLAR